MVFKYCIALVIWKMIYFQQIKNTVSCFKTTSVLLFIVEKSINIQALQFINAQFIKGRYVQMVPNVFMPTNHVNYGKKKILKFSKRLCSSKVQKESSYHKNDLLRRRNFWKVGTNPHPEPATYLLDFPS